MTDKDLEIVRLHREIRGLNGQLDGMARSAAAARLALANAREQIDAARKILRPVANPSTAAGQIMIRALAALDGQ
jgi:hypothetical protein